jgi:hypothetical protein
MAFLHQQPKDAPCCGDWDPPIIRYKDTVKTKKKKTKLHGLSPQANYTDRTVKTFYRNNLGGFGLGLFCSRYGAMMVMCEHINEPYHKSADMFCAAIVTLVTIIFSRRFLHFKVKLVRIFESCNTLL